jgi:hypothetical protein
MWKLEPTQSIAVMHYIPGEFSRRKCVGVDQPSAASRSRTDCVLIVKHPNYRYCNRSNNAKPLETPCINHLRPFPHLFADEYSLWSVARQSNGWPYCLIQETSRTGRALPHKNAPVAALECQSHSIRIRDRAGTAAIQRPSASKPSAERGDGVKGRSRLCLARSRRIVCFRWKLLTSATRPRSEPCSCLLPEA